MNEVGQVIAWQLTKSTSIDEVHNLLQNVAGRLATNLHSHLLDEQNSNLPICVKTTILYDIAKGLAYLHA